MKIFISSLITGFEAYRTAALSAIRSLGHEAIMAENFGASTSSPRIACLEGVRQAELVILILGAEYGGVQPVTGLSATHEEYREAKDRRPVIAFIEEGVQRDPAQDAFVCEVQDWAGGLFRAGFTASDELRDAIIRAIHNYQLSLAAAPVDAGEMLDRALALLLEERSGYVSAIGPLLRLAVVGGPAQTILRPVEIEDQSLARALLREANYGDNSIFDSSLGSDVQLNRDGLMLSQQNGSCILLDERGALAVAVPIARGSGMIGALIEEHVQHAISRGLAHSEEMLTHIDPTQRLSRVAIAARISTGGMMGWRTNSEDQASPNSMTLGMGFDRDANGSVHFNPPDRPRVALTFDRDRMAEDLLTLLRRQFR